MAKWGQGDPRWIVENRPDAVNVNNWHWTEKNASSWSKDILKSLLLSVKFETPQGNGEVKEVTSITGEASANNRKGKLIFFYEWDIKLKWKAIQSEEEYDVDGQIEIPNLSEENDMDDVDVSDWIPQYMQSITVDLCICLQLFTWRRSLNMRINCFCGQHAYVGTFHEMLLCMIEHTYMFSHV
jgi:hypothetical protein